MTTARFLVWHNDGYVGLTLQPNESIVLNEGGATEEGYDCLETTYTHDGEGVHQQWERDAKDCDGRLTGHGESYCPMQSLSAREWETEEDGMLNLPIWTKMRHGYRDHAAEAANY